MIVQNMNEWESKYHHDNFNFIFDFDKEIEQVDRLIRKRKINLNLHEKIFNIFGVVCSYIHSRFACHKPA